MDDGVGPDLERARGCVTRLHQLPNESRYDTYGVDGLVIIVSGVSRSEARL